MQIDKIELCNVLGIDVPPTNVDFESLINFNIAYQNNWRKKQRPLSLKNGKSREVLPGVWEDKKFDRYNVSINLNGGDGIPYISHVPWGKRGGTTGPKGGYRQLTKKGARRFSIELREKYKIIGVYMNMVNNANSLRDIKSVYKEAVKLIVINDAKYASICNLANISMDDV
jgi:hypothetical protein